MRSQSPLCPLPGADGCGSGVLGPDSAPVGAIDAATSATAGAWVDESAISVPEPRPRGGIEFVGWTVRIWIGGQNGCGYVRDGWRCGLRNCGATVAAAAVAPTAPAPATAKRLLARGKTLAEGGQKDEGQEQPDATEDQYRGWRAYGRQAGRRAPQRNSRSRRARRSSSPDRGAGSGVSSRLADAGSGVEDEHWAHRHHLVLAGHVKQNEAAPAAAAATGALQLCEAVRSRLVSRGRLMCSCPATCAGVYGRATPTPERRVSTCAVWGASVARHPL